MISWRSDRVVAAASVLVLVVTVLMLVRGAFFAGGADMAHHFAVVHWFSQQPFTPRPDVLREMSYYPAGAHWLAVIVVPLAGSAFSAMSMVGIGAVVMIWACVGGVLALLPHPRNLLALGSMAVVLALSSLRGPLDLQLHGWEVLGNYFYSQVVGQAVFWALVLVTVRGLLRERTPTQMAAPVVAGALLLTAVHVLPSLQLVVLLGLLAVSETGRRYRAGIRAVVPLGVPLAISGATAVAVVLSPGFGAMRRLATNNGALEIPYLDGVRSYSLLAAVVCLVSLASIGAGTRAGDRRTRAVLAVLGAAGLAVALPCLAQAVALAGGEGSPYAIKKYGFGLLTMLVVLGCSFLASAVPVGLPAMGRSPDVPPLWRAPVVLSTAFGLIATASLVLSRPPLYEVDVVNELDRSLTALAAGPLADGGPDVAAGLPGSDPVLDYMLSISSLGAPLDDVTGAVLTGAPVPLERGVATVVTASGSSYTGAGCEAVLAAVPLQLVVVDAGCYAQPPECPQQRRTAAGDSFGDRGLRGFAQPEPGGRWTEGPQASVSCRLPAPLRAAPVRVMVQGTAFLPPGVARQRVVLTARGVSKQLTFTAAGALPALELVLPPGGEELSVSLGLPDAVSPQDAGVSADGRRLGLFVTSISVTAA